MARAMQQAPPIYLKLSWDALHDREEKEEPTLRVSGLLETLG
jgi:hypothetical protein